VRTVFRRFPKGVAGDVAAVRQVRVAGRRLRVALPVLARRPGSRRLRRALKSLRQLTRVTGAGRDHDVSLELYEAHYRSLDSPTPPQELLRRRLRAARARARRRMAEALLDLDIAGLRRDLRSILDRGGEPLFTVISRIREGREREGAALLAGLAALGDRYDPDALHRLRRRARRLRYLAEVNDVVREQDSGAPALWKKLQDAMGLVHDNHVLSEWLGSRASTRARPELAEAARADQAFFAGQARHHHGRLLESNAVELAGAALLAMGQARTAA
jgi:CHAD domain-containing protein